MNSIEDLKMKHLSITAAPDPRDMNGSTLRKIPTKTEEILALKRQRDTAKSWFGKNVRKLFLILL